MKTNAVIETWVLDVMRRLPAKDRNDIGAELRELLSETLADRVAAAGKPPDAAMTLTLLHEFGAPDEVAARYRPPGMVIIPADQTRRFAVWSLLGIALQWALTLPRAFDGHQAVAAWWFSWGLGAFWWPGFIAMMALAAAGVRALGSSKPAWRPHRTTTGRINRGALAVTLTAMMIGMAIVLSLPWLAPMLPDPMPHVFALDSAFLHGRAWPVLLLYLDNFAILVAVLCVGRWTPRLRRIHLAADMLWIALLLWWLVAGNIFVAAPTDAGAKSAIGLVLVFVVVDLAWKLYRGRLRVRAPKVAG